MPNPVKYNTSPESLALRSGNFYLGTGDVPKGGPTLAYWAGVDPPGATAYTIYLNKSANGPSIYQVGGGADLQSLTNRIAGTSYTTDAPCIDYFMSQSDKMIVNRNFGPIVTNGLQFAVDKRSTLSWNGISGGIVYDMQGGGTNSVAYQWTNLYVQSWADSPSSLTICCLIRRRATPTTSTQYPISKLGTIGSNFNLASFGLRAVWDGSNSSLTWVGPGTSSYTALGQENFATFGSVVDQTSWVGLQYSSSTGQAWFNGNKVGGTGGTTLATNTGNLSLLRIPGTSTTGAASYEIIQALFYNRELTDAEMYQNYQASIAPPVGSFYGGGIVFATEPFGTTGATGTAYIVANVNSGPQENQNSNFTVTPTPNATNALYAAISASESNTTAMQNAAASAGVTVSGIAWARNLSEGGFGPGSWSLASFGAATAIHNNIWKPSPGASSAINRFASGMTMSAESVLCSNKSGASTTQGMSFNDSGRTSIINQTAQTSRVAWAVRSQTYSVTDVT
jgi:hypothetical protein